jgi:hypothetical protein
MTDFYTTWLRSDGGVRPYACEDGTEALIETASDCWPVQILAFAGHGDTVEEAIVVITNPDTGESWQDVVGVEELFTPAT